jgi:hypothetical protein
MDIKRPGDIRDGSAF